MQLLDAELNNVKRLYDEQMAVFVETGIMPIHKNMAPVSGSLKWAQELRDRITVPMNEFRRLDHPYVVPRCWLSALTKVFFLLLSLNIQLKSIHTCSRPVNCCQFVRPSEKLPPDAFIRSTSPSRPNNMGRKNVHPSTKSFFDFNEIWFVGRGR